MFEKLCRLCANLKDDLVNIFDNTPEMQKIQWQVFYILHIRIQSNDVLPTGVCSACVENLQKTFDFVSYCHNVQKTFKQQYDIFLSNGASSFENFEKIATIAAESMSNFPFSSDARMNLRSFRPEAGYLSDFFSSWQMDCEMTNADQKEKSPSKSETSADKNSKFCTDESYAVHAPDLLECKLGNDNNGNDSSNDTDYHPSYSSDEEITDSERERKPSITDSEKDIKPSKPSKKVSKTGTAESSTKKATTPSSSKKKSKVKREKLVCEVCHQTFITKIAYEDHLNIHTGDRPHACKLCEATFRKLRELKQHVRTVHSSKTFNCTLCSHVAKHKGKLTEHMKIMHDKPLKCGHCNYRTGEKSKIAQHIANKHSTEFSFICELCGSGFKTKSALQSHRQNIHFPEPKMCQSCGILLPSVAKYNAHIFRCGKEKQRYPCEICGESYVNKEILKEHMNKLHGITPYECDICKKEFYQRNRLDAHRFVHLKPSFQCEICNQSFKRKDNMKKHMNKHFPPLVDNSVAAAAQGVSNHTDRGAASHPTQGASSNAVQEVPNQAAQVIPNHSVQGMPNLALQGIPNFTVQAVPNHAAVQGMPNLTLLALPNQAVQIMPNLAVLAASTHAAQGMPNL